jgi:serine/threonine-protein kinase
LNDSHLRPVKNDPRNEQKKRSNSMMKRIAALGVLVVLVGTAAIARDDRYGAIAYSLRTGHYGYTDNAGTRGGAERRAVELCERRDCRVEVWFRNSCGALATSESGQKYGWAQNTSLREAKEIAIRNCRRDGGRGCRVLISACTR